MAPSGASSDDPGGIKAAMQALAAGEDAAFRAALDTIAEGMEADPEGVRAAIAASVPALTSSPVISIVEDAWLAGAVVSEGRVVHADAAFGASRATQDALAQLAARASGRSRAFATVRIADGSLAVAVAGRGQQAAAWPLSEAMRAAMASPRATAILAFSQSDAAGLSGVVQAAFGMTPAEARLAAVLFRGSSVEQAAGALGISADTARKTVRALLRKTGTLRRAGLTARIAELLAGHYLRGRDRIDLIQEAFGLSGAEARVADAVAQGLTVREIAQQRQVSAHTVRAQLDAALLKTGVARAPDLARILVNLCALVSWTSCSEPRRQDQRDLIAATRIIPAPGGRRIAAADFGPPQGAPVLCFHPGLSYRWVRRRLREAFQEAGFRTISYDRAGCGLSDPQAGHAFDAAAEDAALVLDRFKIHRTRIFAAFGGAGPALAFAARYPERVSEGVLLMPRTLRSETTHPAALTRLWRSFSGQPAIGESFFEAVRLVAGSRLWRWLQAQVARSTAADRLTLRDDAYNDERMSEIFASIARGIQGTVDMDRGYQAGWERPVLPPAIRWTVLSTAAQPHRAAEADDDGWAWLPGVRLAAMAEAGRFAMHTHAREIAGLFTPPGRRAA